MARLIDFIEPKKSQLVGQRHITNFESLLSEWKHNIKFYDRPFRDTLNSDNYKNNKLTKPNKGRKSHGKSSKS